MAAVRATWKVVPWMTEARSGVIVQITSISGLEAGSPPAYAAAKAALISHAQTLAVALAPQGIRVDAVAPGSIDFPDGAWDRVKKNDHDFYNKVFGTIPVGPHGNPGRSGRRCRIPGLRPGKVDYGRCVPVDGGQHKANL